MALFGKKKGTDDAGAQDAGSNGHQEAAWDDTKAKAFFDKAKIVYNSTNYQYSMQLWLNGLGWSPTSMDGMEGFLQASAAFLEDKPKGKLDKDFKSGLTAKGKVRKYIDTLLDFGLRRTDAGNALKVAEAAANCGLREPAKMLGRVAFQLTRNDEKRQKKDVYVKIMDVLESAEDFENAAMAGDMAVRLDPSDGPLQMRARNMAAQATMSQGGFEDQGEGGFKRNVRNIDKQTELEQQDTIAKTDDVKDQLVARTKAAHQENPEDVPTIEAYAKALVERGKKSDLMLAMGVLSKAHKQTGQFRFRERAGDAKLRLMRRNIEVLRQSVEASPDDAEKREKYESQLKALAQTEIDELRVRVEAYPTDLPLKFKLGQALVGRGEYEEAIGLLQEAEADAKFRVEARLALAEAFQKLGGWEDAAIDAYRKASVEVKDPEVQLRVQYKLMVALRERAERDRSVESAQEADKLAETIAMKKFGYEDIQEQRKAIKELLKELPA